MLATLTTNLEVGLWAPNKNYVEGAWEQAGLSHCVGVDVSSTPQKFNVTSLLLEHFGTTEDSPTNGLLQAQIECAHGSNTLGNTIHILRRYGMVYPAKTWAVYPPGFRTISTRSWEQGRINRILTVLRCRHIYPAHTPSHFRYDESPSTTTVIHAMGVGDDRLTSLAWSSWCRGADDSRMSSSRIRA